MEEELGGRVILETIKVDGEKIKEENLIIGEMGGSVLWMMVVIPEVTGN